MRGFLGTWRTNAHALHVKRLEDLRAAVQMWQNALARKSIVLWSENVKRIRTERAALEQQQFLMSMMDEATREREVRDMTEAEEYMRRFYAEEAAFIEAETLKRNWEEKRVLNSNYITNDLRKLRFKQFQLSALAGEPH